MTDLLLRLVEHVRRERLFPHPGGAVVAVSGGSDSVALLDLVNSARQEFGLDLSIGHVDHGTGTTADAARSVERLADRFKLPIHQLSLNLGPDWTETGARNGRYELLLGLLEDVGGRYIVMGHHADDQIETVLMRFLKGSGPAGLAGIGHRSGPVVRPLLPFRKRELADWVAARGLRDLVCEDPSNLDERHLRNWIRNTVLP
ncbi:MAG: tRNA lysidine(34) synthetase TilS, partial [Gemmatimonadales bacterium]